MIDLRRITPRPTTAEPRGFYRTLPLEESDCDEALEFLDRRPHHAFILSGFLRENGLSRERNRGTFYACRAEDGRLLGVALIGHSTLIETTHREAIEEFARRLQSEKNAHMIMAEPKALDLFWRAYAPKGQRMRRRERQLLLTLSATPKENNATSRLRPANADDLALLLPIHAQLARQESGADPLIADPEGFRRRCAQRIEQGRVWVWRETDRVLFKADLITRTPAVIYLEGVYVAPDIRGRGFGRACVAELAQRLAADGCCLSLFVNVRNREARRLYGKVGFEPRAIFDAIFLHQRTECASN
ncbi:MAG: hypothetical protein C4334_00660 [Pyrinomonas sp.]|uniref:GNAT family N-acetyltransferase n=1 Tax=Pyrinomonas sp. TaxID=2080306 RepID=UPI00332DF4D7